jgi:hypothetical protein
VGNFQRVYRLKASFSQAGLGFAVLAIGALVYLIGRPFDPGHVLSYSNLAGLAPWLGMWGGNVPSFTHAAAFSLLTSAWLGGRLRVGAWACVAWFVIDAGCEFAQHPDIARALLACIPDWIDVVPVLDRIDGYLAHSTFDTADLLSVAIGTGCALALIRWTQPFEVME